MALPLLTTDEGDGAGHRAPDLDAIAANLKPGQWVRVEWRDEYHRGDTSDGITEGTVRVSEQGALFVGPTIVRDSRGGAAFSVTAIETQPRPPLDLDELSDLLDVWRDAQRAWETKPLGRNGTGSNDAEQNALYVAEQVVREYLGSHR